jgi:hypothetical protein
MRPVLVVLVAFSCVPRDRTEEERPGSVDGGGGGGPSCGNGVIDPGELCDPCPADCDDGNGCTLDVPTGSTATCDLGCGHAPLTACAGGDGCCPLACDEFNDADCALPRLAPEFELDYELTDLGSVPGVPPLYGGITFPRGDATRMLIGGHANTMEGTLHSVTLVRDAGDHITGFDGTALMISEAAWNDGLLDWTNDGVLVLARWPTNELGQIRPSSMVTDKVIDLAPLGVVDSAAGGYFPPTGTPGAGRLKLLSWAGGEWYDVALVPDGTGTYDIGAAILRATLSGGPEGVTFVPPGSSGFPAPAILVSEYSSGRVSTYEVDAEGDPIVASRRDFITGLDGAEGAVIDPLTGDFLFSTFGGGDRLIVVRGFAPID